VSLFISILRCGEEEEEKKIANVFEFGRILWLLSLNCSDLDVVGMVKRRHQQSIPRIDCVVVRWVNNFLRLIEQCMWTDFPEYRLWLLPQKNPV